MGCVRCGHHSQRQIQYGTKILTPGTCKFKCYSDPVTMSVCPSKGNGGDFLQPPALPIVPGVHWQVGDPLINCWELCHVTDMGNRPLKCFTLACHLKIGCLSSQSPCVEARKGCRVPWNRICYYTTCVLETKPRPSGKAINSLDHWAFSPGWGKNLYNMNTTIQNMGQ